MQHVWVCKLLLEIKSHCPHCHMGFGEAREGLLSPCTQNLKHWKRLSQGHWTRLERRPTARVTDDGMDASAMIPQGSGRVEIPP